MDNLTKYYPTGAIAIMNGDPRSKALNVHHSESTTTFWRGRLVGSNINLVESSQNDESCISTLTSVACFKESGYKIINMSQEQQRRILPPQEKHLFAMENCVVL
jgi:hypothetical protein